MVLLALEYSLPLNIYIYTEGKGTTTMDLRTMFNHLILPGLAVPSVARMN